MFLEISKRIYEEIIPQLKEFESRMIITDCTPVGTTDIYYNITFNDISPKEEKYIYDCYKKVCRHKTPYFQDRWDRLAPYKPYTDYINEQKGELSL